MADNFTERENYILSNSVNIGWFLEAIDKNNPLHPEEGAAHTESYELDGQNILVPRVRIKDGKAVLNKENALEEALERGDYIVVPEGEDPDQYSKDLSKLIGKFRGFDRGGLATQTERAMGTVGPQSELERQRSKNIAEQMSTLSREENDEEKFIHPLETVPFFQRPKGSSTDDIQVGEDDAGNPVFQGRLGTYIVRLNPDQRTTRQKITEAIPTIKESVSEYLEDPKLPTKEQMGQFARAATIGAIEDLGETMFTPKGTLGDVFSLASGAGAASVPFDVPKGALRIFGGVGAEGAAKDKNLKKAIKLLKKSGVNPTNTQESYFTNKNIWEQTGWFVDPNDGQWRFEIDDAKSSIDAGKFREKSVVTFDEFKDESVDPKLKLPLKDIFKHENLYIRYPDLKNKTITLYSEPKSKVRGKVIDGDQILINAGHSDFNDITDIRSTLLHEIQHVIQNKEVGFAPGASLAAVDPKLIEGRSKELADLKTPLKVKAAALNKQLDNPKLSDQKKLEIVQELQKVQGDIIRLDAEDLGSEFEFYRGASGEIEARLVQRRQEGSNKFPVQDRIEMVKEEKEKRKPAGNFNYSRKLDPYLYKKESRQEPESPNFLSGIKKKLGLSESRENPDIEPEVEDAFTKLADIQRGEPELAMVEAQKIYGGGVMPYALEHAGDLTHRMAERGGRFGAEFVAPKVRRLLDSLLSDYGFEKEMLENIQSNARFHYKGDNPNISFEEYKKEYENNIDKALNKYSKAHKKVPVYNRMQLAGREAAIAIGEKRYTDAIENLYIIDQAIKDGTYKQAALEFDPNIDFRKKPKDFNKGGTVMNRQMEMAFMREGGLKDDGMKVDPVSGNKIPPGSMAKEVRDDIPAQLSEGEYVVPADVVQFYGVKHFEDLRNKAKGGLKQMENDGRIGGEPVYANTGTMVQGGFSGPSVAPAQPGVAQTPMPLQNPAPFNPMQTPLQGNPGAGFVYQTPGQQAYNLPTRYYGSFSNAPQSITQAPNTPVPVVGQPVTPPIDTPESCAARGMVFNPETGMCVLPDPVQTPQPTGGDDRDKPDVPQVDPNAWMKDYNYTSDNTLFATSAEELNRPQTIMEKIFGGGILGALGKAGTAAQIAANVKILEAQGSIDLAKSLQSRLDKYKEDNNLDWLPDFLIGGSRLSASALEVLKLDPTSLVNAKAPYRTPTAEQIKISTGRDVTGGGLEEAKKIKEKTEKEGPTEKQKEAAARVESALKESKSVEEILAPDKKEKERRSEFHEKLHNDMVAKAARERAQEAADKLGVGLATGGRNKGGLMRKKKK